ncbi:MAG: hypothetical protein LUG98_00455 [Tannerellaceae bacterium]|nr:hypothetical protein [Tannerellaceae bacterium]
MKKKPARRNQKTKSKENANQMMREFFVELYPSVRNYNHRLKSLPKEEQLFYERRMFQSSLCGWTTLSRSQQTFLRCLIKRNPQKYLDYLFENTVLEDLRYEVQDPILVMHFIELIDTIHRKEKFNRRQMLFAFLRSFFCHLTYNTTYEMLRLKNKRGEEDGQ